MKFIVTIFALLVLFADVHAQPAKKVPQGEKMPSQKEIQDMMKQAQSMMNDMSPEDKRMLDSLGIKMPDLNKAAKTMASVPEAQLRKAWEDENRIVPAKDASRISLGMQAVTAGTLSSFVQKMNAAVLKRFSQKEITVSTQAYQAIQAKLKGNPKAVANAAVQLWIMGKYKAAIFILGKIAAGNPTNADVLNNYAALLTMAGAEELALPVLNYLDKQSPQNSTLYNNIAQAWFGLGEIQKADEYAKKCIALCAWHPQANMVASKIAESKGNKTEAVKFARQAMKYLTSPEKEAQMRKLGYAPTADDYHLPRSPKTDPLNLGGWESPAFPLTVDECIAGSWKIFRDELSKEKANLSKQLAEANKKAEEEQAAITKAGISRLKSSFGKNSFATAVVFAPMHAVASGKKQDQLSKDWLRKMLAVGERQRAFTEGPGAQLKRDYDNDMKELKKRDNEQTGEGKPNVDFCPQYKERSNQFLKAYNTQMEQFYKEYLTINKVFLNELANLQMYGSWPQAYEAQKINDKIAWLRALSNEEAHFQEITTYNCIKGDNGKRRSDLAKFKDPKCEELSTMNLGFASMSSNCYEIVTKLELEFLDLELFSVEMHQNDENVRDAQNTLDYIIQSFTNATIEAGPSEEAGITAGPFKLEAEIGAKVIVELSKDGITDIGVKATAEVKATASEIKGGEDVGVKTELTIIGTEAKVTVNSGFTVEGKGILKVLNN